MNLIKAITNDYPPCRDCKYCVSPDRHYSDCHSPRLEAIDKVTGKQGYIDKSCSWIRGDDWFGFHSRLKYCKFTPKERG